MKEKNAIFIIDILKSIINVYFDTFFVFYFFNVANYEIIPLAKYYITLYLFVGIGFFLIRKAIKKNIKVGYFRIGISLQALYIALIMLLKENIINYVYLVAILKGVADGFYWYPKNILNTEKITNEDRQKYSGTINTVCQIIAIIIPLILGVLLTYFSYVDLGKIFFVLFIFMYLVSFYLKDIKYTNKKFEFKKFKNLLMKNKRLKYALIKPLLSGFTYSSGVMYLIITLYKIYNFKTNLNLGFVSSVCSFICLISCILFGIMIKKEKFNKTMIISGIISFITTLLFIIFPSRWSLILFMIVDNFFITFITLISSNVVVNYSNSKEINENLKPEFYCIADIIVALSRVLGYFLLLVVCIYIGQNYINYILIIPAISLLIESVVIGKLSKEINNGI